MCDISSLDPGQAVCSGGVCWVDGDEGAEKAGARELSTCVDSRRQCECWRVSHVPLLPGRRSPERCLEALPRLRSVWYSEGWGQSRAPRHCLGALSPDLQQRLRKQPHPPPPPTDLGSQPWPLPQPGLLKLSTQVQELDASPLPHLPWPPLTSLFPPYTLTGHSALAT